MPTYQYACMDADCGNQFELVQSFTDPAASECPTCSSPVRKVYSAVGVVFKGSGFYRTDSRSSANGTAKAEKDSASPSSSGSNASSSSSSADSSSASSSSSSSSSSSGSTPAKAASA